MSFATRRNVASRQVACFEPLEDRRLKSTTLSSGIVTIEGSEQADRIVVRTDNTGYLIVEESKIATSSSTVPTRLPTPVVSVTRLPLYSISSISVRGNGGNDLVKISARTIPAFVQGGAGNDTIWGGDGNDNLTGGAGTDEIHGGNGNDSIHGGKPVSRGGNLYADNTGADVLIGDAGNDVLSASVGDCALFGGTGDDQLYGSYGNDYLYGDSGNDYLSGGDGNDTLNAWDGIYGNDVVVGGNGYDTAYTDRINFGWFAIGDQTGDVVEALF